MTAKKKSRRTSFFTSIISVAFVLFSLGLLGILLFQTNKIFTGLKEKIEINLFIADSAEESTVNKLKENLSDLTYVKNVTYISKEKAKEEFSQTFDMTVLEENPLPSSFSVTLHAKYANPDSLAFIVPQLEQSSLVQEVFYQEDVLHLINTNVQKIGLILLAFSILLFLIALTLIDSSIRLSLFSKRFLIKSMQLVGAKNRFILKPFLQKGVKNGFLSSLIAITLVGIVVYYLSEKLGLFEFSENRFFWIILAVSIILLGILLSVTATWFSVNKYLKTRVEELY